VCESCDKGLPHPETLAAVRLLWRSEEVSDNARSLYATGGEEALRDLFVSWCALVQAGEANALALTPARRADLRLIGNLSRIEWELVGRSISRTTPTRRLEVICRSTAAAWRLAGEKLDEGEVSPLRELVECWQLSLQTGLEAESIPLSDDHAKELAGLALGRVEWEALFSALAPLARLRSR
jgi:hypothetical protein